MHEHKVPEVQQAACFAIRSLSLNSIANQISVVKAGGLERLNAALNSLAPLVQKAACAALLALSSCVSVAEKIRLSGAPVSLRSMITAPDVSKDVKRLGEQLLGRLDVCVCVCVCVRVFVYVCIFSVSIYGSRNINPYVCMYVGVYARARVCVCVCEGAVLAVFSTSRAPFDVISRKVHTFTSFRVASRALDKRDDGESARAR
jgi:hypothetical protein